ncbi:biopolymer transport protein [Alcanivorax sp. S71-1-4]|uniref:TonB system transport protein ExbD n=1 Tax=Alcanivorax sp. S71-1-4 TaxID=1177159 RepID=UPI001358406A|nr:TonB system transport protein ExbD [Alcanivorax sp. S71-1-4]KAF0809996.1 biopolymer transport protein [Alcanivorax sp. S71-1-4]
MAFNLSSGAGDELPENHEINVTPFIDVMLVLLIIFMVAAPLATVSVPVDLPAAAATPQPAPKDPVYLTLQRDLTLTLGESRQVSQENLAAALQEQVPDTAQRILLRADRDVAYGDLMQVMNRLSQAGYLKVALVGLEIPGGTDRAAP